MSAARPVAVKIEPPTPETVEAASPLKKARGSLVMQSLVSGVIAESRGNDDDTQGVKDFEVRQTM